MPLLSETTEAVGLVNYYEVEWFTLRRYPDLGCVGVLRRSFCATPESPPVLVDRTSFDVPSGILTAALAAAPVGNTLYEVNENALVAALKEMAMIPADAVEV